MYNGHLYPPMHKPIPTLFMEEMKKQVQNFIVVYRPDERLVGEA